VECGPSPFPTCAMLREHREWFGSGVALVRSAGRDRPAPRRATSTDSASPFTLCPTAQSADAAFRLCVRCSTPSRSAARARNRGAAPVRRGRVQSCRCRHRVRVAGANLQPCRLVRNNSENFFALQIMTPSILLIRRRPIDFCADRAQLHASFGARARISPRSPCRSATTRCTISAPDEDGPLTDRAIHAARPIADPIHLFDCGHAMCRPPGAFLVMRERDCELRRPRLPAARVLATIERHKPPSAATRPTRGDGDGYR